MGLEGVEIIMMVEERFGISIKDGEAEVIRTPRQLIVSEIEVTLFPREAQPHCGWGTLAQGDPTLG